MRRTLDDFPDLQRLSTIGGVFYVHHSPKGPEPIFVEEEAHFSGAESGALDETDVADARAAAADLSGAEEAGTPEEAGASEPASGESFGESSDGSSEEAPVEADQVSGDTPKERYSGPYTRPAPRGYALEFGTGRPVRLLYTPNGTLVTRTADDLPWY